MWNKKRFEVNRGWVGDVIFSKMTNTAGPSYFHSDILTRQPLNGAI